MASQMPPPVVPPLSPLQASDALPPGAAVGVAVPPNTPVVISDAPKDDTQPPDHFIWRYAVSCIMELKDGYWALSLGRVMLLVLYGHALATWSVGHDVPDHEMEVLLGMLSYVFATKLAGGVQEVLTTWKKK